MKVYVYVLYFKRCILSEEKIALWLQLIVHFTKYSVKCSGFHRGGPAVTVLLVPLSACSSGCKTLRPFDRGSSTSPPPFSCRVFSSSASSSSQSTCFSPLLSLLISPCSPSAFSTSILCSVKPSVAPLSMPRATLGCLFVREDKH